MSGGTSQKTCRGRFFHTGFRRKGRMERAPCRGAGYFPADAVRRLRLWLSPPVFTFPPLGCRLPEEPARMGRGVSRFLKYWLGRFALLAALPAPLLGQADTLLSLPEVEVRAAAGLRGEQPGQYSQRWDSAALAVYTGANLADVLGRESGMFAKSYGLGSLATIMLLSPGISQYQVSFRRRFNGDCLIKFSNSVINITHRLRI